MLQVKFFQVNGYFYAKARHDGNVVDRNDFSNIDMQIAEYLKTVMTWGYAADEIECVIDPTISDEYDIQTINRAIDIYVKGE